MWSSDAAANKELKLTSRVNFGAAEFNASVGGPTAPR